MRLILAFLLAMLAGAPALGAKAKKPEPKAEAPACAPLAPLLEKAKAAGVEFTHITDGIAVLKITAVLKENADKPFPQPTSIVVVFVGEVAHIGIVVNDRVCRHLMGPASALRAVLKSVIGISVKDTDI